MNYQRTGILSCIAKTSVFVLYVSFFTVQLFFNFDIANPSSPATLLSYNTSITAVHRSADIKKTNKGLKYKKQTIRLNKRFEPQTIIAHNAVFIKSPICHFDSLVFGLRSFVFIPAPFLLLQSFRGPPVVV